MQQRFKKPRGVTVGAGHTVTESQVEGSTAGKPVLGTTAVENGRHEFRLCVGSGAATARVGIALFTTEPNVEMATSTACWSVDVGSTGTGFAGVASDRGAGPPSLADSVELTVTVDCDAGTVDWATDVDGEVATCKTVPPFTPVCVAVSTGSPDGKVTWTGYKQLLPGTHNAAVPNIANDAVLVGSEEMPPGSVTIEGYDFNNGVDYHAMFKSFFRTGYQATNFGKAVKEINKMRRWRLSHEPVKPDEVDELKDPEVRRNIKTKIFFGYTSNLISSGTREQIRYLVEHKMVDVVVSSAGGIEEDFIKCLEPTYMGDFNLDGATLRRKGINRIGNMLVPNKNYCAFEDWMVPILDAMVEEQTTQGTVWSPSKIIHRMGKEINDPRSVYYWAYKNDIPVFSPALTDGSIGDMVYFHSFNNPGLVIDIASDIRKMNDEAVQAKGKTGIICLGGGMIKHHIHNANLMRNGADFAVIVNTAQPFDGSDSGANPDEAKSWGKIRVEAQPVKICAEASIIFPLLVAETFARKEPESDDEDDAEPVAGPVGAAS